METPRWTWYHNIWYAMGAVLLVGGALMKNEYAVGCAVMCGIIGWFNSDN